jgi:F-type H+-transporting ATPase subunit b
MINFLMLLFSSEVSGPGGLFDIDATLPLIAFEFSLLMVILNIILYGPLLKVIEERKEYILTKLGKASELLAEANKLTINFD